MNRTRSRTARLGLACAASIAGGSLFGACQAHIKNAFVDGSTQYILGVFDPRVNPIWLPADDADDGETTEQP